MRLFDTVYITPAGAKRRDKIEAATIHEVRAIIRKRGGGRVIRAKERTGQAVGNRKLREKDLLLLLELLATYLEGDVTILESLEKLKDSPVFRKRSKAVLRGVYTQMADSRGSFSQACGKYPKAFPKDVVMALRIGEGGGSRAIAETLRGLWEDRKFQNEIRAQAIGKSIYPASLLLASGGLIISVFSVLLPKMQELVAAVNATPPPSMARLLAISKIAHQYGILAAGAGLALVLAVLWTRGRDSSREAYDRALLKLPLIGGIAKEYAVASISTKYRALYKAGEAPGGSLLACAEATKNRAVVAALLRAKVLLEHSIVRSEGGEAPPVTDALRSTGIFPVLALTILGAAEKTGHLERGLTRVADIYSAKVKHDLQVAIKVYQTVVFIVTTSVIAYVTISIWTTIYQASSVG